MQYAWRVLPYLRPYWKPAVFSVVLLFLTSAATLLTPWPLKVLVDNVLQGQPLPPFLAAALGALGEDRTRLLILTASAGLVIAFAENGLTVLNNYLSTRMRQGMVLDIRSDLFQHAQRLSMAYHDEKRTGRLIFAINNQGNSAAGLVMAIPPLVQNALTLGGMFWIVYRIDPHLALLSLLVVPFLYQSIVFYAKRVMPRLRRVKGMEAESLSIVHEAISMLRVIVAFGREHHEYRRFREHGEKAVDERVKVTVGETLFSMAVNMTTAFGTALVLGYGAFRALQGQITVGEMLVVMTYLASVYKPLETISFTASSLQEKFVGLEIIFGLLDNEPEIRDAPDALTIGRAEGRVAFENVRFCYKEREDTLQDIDLQVEPGQAIGIVGPTGAGKTTLVSLLPRFYDVSGGRVLLDGNDIRKITVRSLREQISIVLQEPLLFAGTIAENIRYGRLDATDEEVVAAAKAANAHEFIRRLPKKYRTPLGERGARLSGGERQRISVARAFLKDAPILILDEPTSSVDSKTEAVILEALGRLMVGRTTFVIAHRLSTVRDADRIIVLDQGRIVETGTFDELVARGGLFHQFLQAQSGRKRGKAVVGGIELAADAGGSLG